jgi:hypothetical protein
MGTLFAIAAVSVAAIFKVLIVLSVAEAWRVGDRAAGAALIACAFAYGAVVFLVKV